MPRAPPPPPRAPPPSPYPPPEPPAPQSEPECLVVQVVTDKFPEDTSWRLFDNTNNESVAARSIGYFTDKWTKYDDELCVEGGDYTFVIVDGYGDGMTDGDPGPNGNYTLKTSGGQVLASNAGEFATDRLSFSFTSAGALSQPPAPNRPPNIPPLVPLAPRLPPFPQTPPTAPSPPGAPPRFPPPYSQNFPALSRPTPASPPLSPSESSESSVLGLAVGLPVGLLCLGLNGFAAFRHAPICQDMRTQPTAHNSQSSPGAQTLTALCETDVEPETVGAELPAARSQALEATPSEAGHEASER